MNSQTFPQLSSIAVKELSDEDAASCSGGKGYLNSKDPDVVLYDYWIPGLGGRGKKLGINAAIDDGVTNIGFSNGDGTGASTGFNDKASYIEVKRGEWVFYTDENYRGSALSAKPGKYALLRYGFNNKITSALRVG